MEATLSTFAATLFALLNPLGMLPVFIGYTDGLGAGVQRWLALLVTLTVLGLMIIFLLTGNNILHFFGITLDAFRMAGGIILLLIGIRIVNAVANQKSNASAAGGVGGDLGEAESVYRMIVVPFAMPLLVGPGVIANLILYAAEAKNSGSDTMFLGLLAVIIGVSLLTFLILLSARPLQRVLGEVGLSIVTRILGLLVAAIGMQFVVSGTTDTIVHVIAPAILHLH
ncbi:MarC family protein [uncultured Thiodictyon sp.]|uniref:MarC family protein n=1 Tax=uncultured Thiodictyon sp. TaxID=1846217 RepID=UPI0025DE4AF0|nr:MarC family protein [uncultured Thiodictyon sp.]